MAAILKTTRPGLQARLGPSSRTFISKLAGRPSSGSSTRRGTEGYQLVAHWPLVVTSSRGHRCRRRHVEELSFSMARSWPPSLPSVAAQGLGVCAYRRSRRHEHARTCNGRCSSCTRRTDVHQQLLKMTHGWCEASHTCPDVKHTRTRARPPSRAGGWEGKESKHGEDRY